MLETLKNAIFGDPKEKQKRELEKIIKAKLEPVEAILLSTEICGNTTTDDPIYVDCGTDTGLPSLNLTEIGVARCATNTAFM